MRGKMKNSRRKYIDLGGMAWLDLHTNAVLRGKVMQILTLSLFHTSCFIPTLETTIYLPLDGFI